ncbi:MAG: class I SAM-dependent methyltransferase [Planctomycetales bacterium]|nr:class I SAM-dependent methyltransferase [Planctomycetales bacterium]
MHPLNTPGIRWLKRSQAALRKFGSWLEAIQSGVFMGLVDDQAFQAFDTYPFDESQPMNVAAEAERGLEAWERRIVREHFDSVQSVLVVAAGGGRELIELDKLGFQTTGFEYGRKLYEATRRELILQSCGASIVKCERFDVPRAEHMYDAAYIARKFLSHVHDRQVRIELLANIRRTLRPDAKLAIGYYTRERDTLAFRMQAGLANTLRKLRGRREFPVEVGDHLDTESPLYHHHYVWEELRDELREAGFTPDEHGTTWFGWAVASVTSTHEPSGASSNDQEEVGATAPELIESR